MPRPALFAAALRAIATQMHATVDSVPGQWHDEPTLAAAGRGTTDD